MLVSNIYDHLIFLSLLGFRVCGNPAKGPAKLFHFVEVLPEFL